MMGPSRMSRSQSNDDDESNLLVRSLDIEAHPTELAIVLKIGPKREQKIIYLKDLTSSADAAVVARFVLDKCPVIPATRGAEVEQIVHYLQRRTPQTSGGADLTKTASNVAALNSNLASVDSYIEMLYEDNEKTKGTAHVLSLSGNTDNLTSLVENDVLMAALTRVFREDSKKNFELATNIAIVFLRMSEYRQLQPILSHYKVGALSMQLIENELKRWEIWRTEAKVAVDKAKKKWEFAIHRQDELVAVLLRLLLNLADDIRVENKIVKRGILPLLVKCLEHGSVNLQIAATLFLWKLSVFVENKDALATSNVIERVVALFPASSMELSQALLSLLFNLSFDPSLRLKMVSAGLVPFVAPAIESDPTALALLYQLSVVDDAKAMITFTDAIASLVKMVTTDPSRLLVKGLLINAALETRNAQLICSSDGHGLAQLIDLAMERRDELLIKVCRNIASHQGATQELFQPHLVRLLTLAQEYVASTGTRLYPFAVECLATVAQLSSVEWVDAMRDLELVDWLRNQLMAASARSPTVPDDLLLQCVILIGSIALNNNAARLLLPVVPQLTQLFSQRHEDDEIVLQIVYAFYCLLCHPDLSAELCVPEASFIEYLVGLMHDPNVQLRNMCDQALQFIAESNEYWRKRVGEERFRFHNAQWIEMINAGPDVFNGEESFVDDFDNVVLGTAELEL